MFRLTRAAFLGLFLLPAGLVPAMRVPGPVEAGSADQGRGPFLLDRQPRQGALIRGIVPSGTVRLAMDGQEIPFSQDRSFIAGFGRDHGEVAQLTAVLADGHVVSETLEVASTRWLVETISRVRRRTAPDAEFLARRATELEQIERARVTVTDAVGWRQSFIWPVPGRITGHFGAQRIYGGEPAAPHGGVDLASATGTPVVAPAEGVVVLATDQPFTLEGKLVMIDHGMGLNSAFLHLSRIDVKAGDAVRQGDRIGAVGKTGRATGPHLHWGMKWRNERIDPAMLARPER